ncbi:MAG TPA: VanZ family protein [Chitinophagaceae bacterium]
MKNTPDVRRPARTRIYLNVVFIGYLCAVIALTIIPSERFSLNRTIPLKNFIPVLNTYKRYAMVTYFENYQGIKNFWQNFIGNIFLFIPMGVFLKLVLRLRFKNALITAFAVSVFIELIQYTFSFFGYYRYVDVDDVILNTIGAAIGFGLWRICRSMRLFRLNGPVSFATNSRLP